MLQLEIHLPLRPMEALSVQTLPAGDEWQYEPKWDGFRCLAFREGPKIELQPKSTQPLARYFPELVAALRLGFTGNAPVGPSRWNRGQEKTWQPLRHKLVVEIRFDHVTANSFRHGTKLLRWRPDKAPEECTMD